MALKRIKKLKSPVTSEADYSGPKIPKRMNTKITNCCIRPSSCSRCRTEQEDLEFMVEKFEVEKDNVRESVLEEMEVNND